MKGGPLQKGQNQPKKKGKLDGKQYVSLGTSPSSSSLAQPPTPPKPSRLRGTPAQPEREGLPERQPPTPPPPKPLKKGWPWTGTTASRSGKRGRMWCPTATSGPTGISKQMDGRSSSSALLAGKGGRKCCSGPKACPSNGQA